MTGLPLGFVIESIVAILLAITIGYCILLNRRLQRLQADRSALQQMIADLVNATNMANSAIGGLRQAAVEADESLNQRLNEAERFAIELASHVNAGNAVVERIAKITAAAGQGRAVPADPRKARSALDALEAHQRSRENAA